MSSNSKRKRKGPLLVVSNRLPVTLQRGTGGLERKRSTGGLVSALEPVLAKQGGTWVGWPGMKLRTDERLSEADDPYQMLPVELTDTEVNRYYCVFRLIRIAQDRKRRLGIFIVNVITRQHRFRLLCIRFLLTVL